MTRQVLPTLDLRTQAERQGITRTQQTVQAIAGIMRTAGEAERTRREGQTLDRIARAIAGGATTIEAITAAAGREPEFATGVPGALQRFGGAFQPTGGGIRQSIQQAVIGQTLQQALAPAPKPIPLGEAERLVTPTGETLVEARPTPKTKTISHVITDPENPDRAIRVADTLDEQGNLVNRQLLGEATLAEKIGGVAAEGLQKGTQTKLENDIIELQTTLVELEAIDKQFDEDFFTFIGKGTAALTAFFEKAKIPVGKAQQEFLGKKTTFFADAKRVFLKFRKFITGVAGGIEEFREIAKATIDPESDSPTQFKAKMNSMRDNAVRTRNVLLAIRNSGLNPNNPEILKQVFTGLSLKSVPLDVPGTITLESLTGQVETQELIVSPFALGQEGQTATDPKTGKKMVRRKDETGKLKWFPLE